MTNMYFQVASFFYMLMILILFFSKERLASRETKLFALLSVVNIIGIIIDIIIVYLSYKTPGIRLLYILNKLYLLYIIYWVSLFCIYISNLSLKVEKNHYKIKNFAFFVNIIGTLLIFILPIYLFNQNNVMYTYGPSVTTTYIVVAIYVVVMLFMIRKNIKQIISKKYSPILILMILSFMGLIVRQMNPALLLTTTIITYINVLMYHTIENPDMKLLKQMELAKNDADKANRAKSDFLSSMSHEIRTPLNAIVGFSELIRETNSIKEAHHDAEDVIKASNTLLEIVNGILDISKIESGKLEIVNSPYSSKELFNEVARLMMPKMDEKSLDFQVHISPDIPSTLYGDHSNIKKIITNLLSNSYKYTNKGFVKYEVRCINHKEISRLIISVEDSGRGIKRENIDKLFTKFQRLNEDRNTTIEGTGLGLAITKQIVELMGGKVIVQSVYGSGSKFTVIVDQKISNVDIQKEEKEEGKLDLIGKKILVVDDNQLNLKVATKMLLKYHPDIDVVSSGFDCIDYVKKNHYDLILLDDMMPKMSGVETLKRLKKNPKFSTMVVALTANAISGMKEKYLKEGFDDYLAKPINKDELKNILMKCANQSNHSIDFGKLPDEIYEVGTSSSSTIIPVKSSSNILIDHGVSFYDAIDILGDVDTYCRVMREFLAHIDEILQRLNDDIELKNGDDYSTVMHSVRNDLKCLGFNELSDFCLEGELKSEDIHYLKKHIIQFKYQLDKMIILSKKYLGD